MYEDRMIYTHISAEALLEDTDQILEIIAHFEQEQLPRLQRLYAYSIGQNEKVLETPRRAETDVADIRTPHDFAGYISTFMTGYLTGNPIQVEYDDQQKDSPTDLAILDVDTKNNAKAHNSLLVRDASIFGRAYEIIYRHKNDITRYRKLSPMNTIVIYNMLIERERIAAIRFYDNPFTEMRYIEFYDATQKITFVVDGENLREEKKETHHFGDVPIHELENNEERMGDFEKVIPQIDLYDFAQSDTANYMQDFNDAILAIFGDVDFGENLSDEDKIELMKKMRQARLLHLKPPKSIEGKEGNLAAQYLVKNYDVSGSEAYKDRIQSDIHKFTFTPDLTDENFAGVQSGEALKYKLFGLEVLGTTKEQLLRKFLQERYSLVFKMGSLAQETSEFDPTMLKVTIVPKLPHSLQEAIKNFTDLNGDMTNESKLRISGVVEDPAEEQKKLEEEEAKTPNLLDRQLSEIPEEGDPVGDEEDTTVLD